MTPGPEPGLVSAVIVNWNGAHLLPDCLRSLRAQTHRPLEVIVVDNGSSDGSLQLLEQEPDLKLIRNTANLGFAAASNQGIAASGGEYVLLLNEDVVLEPDYVARLVAALQADPRRGSATGKLLREVGHGQPSVIDSAGHLMYRCLWAVNRGQGQPDGPDFDSAEEVFGVCAAAALYRRATLEDVALEGEILDETFFSYLEDVDLDWRAQLRGWKAWYEPSAVARHLRSGAGLRGSTRIQRHVLKNRLLLMVKNDGGGGLWRRLPAVAAFTAAKLGQLLLTRPSALLGLVDFCRALPAALRKRRLVQKSRLRAPKELEGWFAPVWPWRRTRGLRHLR